jgi:hypothetical protein
MSTNDLHEKANTDKIYARAKCLLQNYIIMAVNNNNPLIKEPYEDFKIYKNTAHVNLNEFATLFDDVEIYYNESDNDSFDQTKR